MATTNVIAFDLGAGSGRAGVGRFDGTCIAVTEEYRFINEPIRVNYRLYWDFRRLFSELKSAFSRLDKGIWYSSVGIDAWGADFGLVNRDGQLLGEVYHYRDLRTDGIVEQLLARISARQLFELTGSDLKRHYTLCQLYALLVERDPVLQAADRLLFVPDLLNYMFTGEKNAEITIAGTSQLLDSAGVDWNYDLLSLLEIPERLFLPFVPPCTPAGSLLPEFGAETGLNHLPLVAVAGHDSASAVTSIPDLQKNSAFVSAGTTIVVGVEATGPTVNDEAFRYGFKNCRGTEGAHLLIRNNTGFWILQQCRRLWETDLDITFDDLSNEARDRGLSFCFIDTEASDFENPENMIESIRAFAARTHQKVPSTRADITRCVFESLVLQVRWCVDGLASALGIAIARIHLIGGGATSRFFCKLVSDCLGLPVYAGPVEATILGNVMTQLLAKGEVSSVSDIRQVVKQSAHIPEFTPNEIAHERWNTIYGHFLCYRRNNDNVQRA
jgi:rhamnulokinase